MALVLAFQWTHATTKDKTVQNMYSYSSTWFGRLRLKSQHCIWPVFTSVGRERTPSCIYTPVAGKPVFSNLIIYKHTHSATPMINSRGLFKLARGCSTVLITIDLRISLVISVSSWVVSTSSASSHVQFASFCWLKLLFHAGATVASGQHITKDNVSLPLCGTFVRWFTFRNHMRMKD
jgi:hypothetical protein